jgi:hypothetical protein
LFVDDNTNKGKRVDSEMLPASARHGTFSFDRREKSHELVYYKFAVNLFVGDNNTKKGKRVDSEMLPASARHGTLSFRP